MTALRGRAAARIPRLILRVGLGGGPADAQPDGLTPALLDVMRGNHRRLHGAGVLAINAGDAELVKAHRRLLWALEGQETGPRPARLARSVAELNAALIDTAAAEGIHTVVLCHDQALGYQPWHLASGAFYPAAEQILAALVQGFDPGHVTLLIDAQTHSQAAADPGTADKQADPDSGAGPERLADLVARIGRALPRIGLLVRGADPQAPQTETGRIDTFLRDIGVDPAMLRMDRSTAATDIPPTVQPPFAPAAPGATEGLRQGSASPSPSDAPLTIYFMVEPGPLELQAHLLVASLQVNCLDPLRMTGFCRHDRIDHLHPDTVGFLQANGVTLTPLVNDFPDGYPAGNKLIASAMVEAPGWAMFMDTDMALVRASSFLDQAVSGMVSMCLESVNGWRRDAAAWTALYAAVGQQPGRPVRLLDGTWSHPLFNAGLVLFQRRSGGNDFGRLWLDTAQRLDAAPDVPARRPWLDTIALPATLARPDADLARIMDPVWNCTTRLAGPDVRVLHYHGVRQLQMHRWTERIDAILAASASPHQTLAAAVDHHTNAMGIPGDLMRRAMRHGATSG